MNIGFTFTSLVVLLAVPEQVHAASLGGFTSTTGGVITNQFSRAAAETGGLRFASIGTGFANRKESRYLRSNGVEPSEALVRETETTGIFSDFTLIPQFRTNLFAFDGEMKPFLSFGIKPFSAALPFGSLRYDWQSDAIGLDSQFFLGQGAQRAVFTNVPFQVFGPVSNALASVVDDEGFLEGGQQ